MKRLWAPWRMAYIKGAEDGVKQAGCIFCLPPSPAQDRERLVLWRGQQGFVMMNRYPYINGHLLVAPYRHLSQFSALTAAENSELQFLLQQSQEALAETMQPQGYNIGLNVGSAGGAGKADHLHWHLLPRWQGDTNFMTPVADIRVIPQDLEATYDLLVPVLERRMA